MLAMGGKSGGREKKKQKAKKSINALILASGALATPSVPSFFSTIQIHLRPRTKADGPIKPRALSPSRRAQSMCILSSDTTALAAVRSNALREPTNSNERRIPPRGPLSVNPSCEKTPGPSSPGIDTPSTAVDSTSIWAAPIPRAADPPKTKIDDDEELDFDAEFGFTDVRPTPLFRNGDNTFDSKFIPDLTLKREPTIPKRGTPQSSDRNISPRRIQSAPTGLLKTYNETLLLDDDEDGDEWFVASVKAKAERRLGRGGLVGANMEEEEDEGIKLESWDDDFDVEDGGGLEIPDAVKELQGHIKGDVVNLKKFALHIEDLKLIYLDATDMESGISSTNPALLPTLQKPYTQSLEQAQVLIALGDYAEDRPDSTAPTERHLRVLADMLTGGSKDRLTSQAAEDVVRMVEVGNLDFGVELMPAVVKYMGPLKGRLREYVDVLRRVLVDGV